MTDNPLFSIIVVSYNASTLIKDTIDSILKQTFDDYEIVVKDACSTDITHKRPYSNYFKERLAHFNGK